MSVAVAGDLVLLSDDLPDEAGVGGGDLSQDEEGRQRFGGSQERQHSLGARLDAALETCPRAVRPFLKYFGVEILLHVHAKSIHDGPLRFHCRYSETTLPGRAGIPHVALRVSTTRGASSTIWR